MVPIKNGIFTISSDLVFYILEMKDQQFHIQWTGNLNDIEGFASEMELPQLVYSEQFD
jgi:hypothetical protein